MINLFLSLKGIIQILFTDILIDVFLCFSLIRNSKRVMDTKVIPGTVSSFDGIRVLSMTWVIFYHVFYRVQLGSAETSTCKLPYVHFFFIKNNLRIVKLKSL